MEQWITALFDSTLVLQINGILGFVLLGFFLCFYFSKEGRDERGRGIVATAAFVAFLSLFVLLNILPMRLEWLRSDYNRLLNGIQLVYTLFLLTADVALLILRKIR